MSYEKDTYSLAKGLHHINIAKQYFEDVKIGCTGDLKNTFNGYINKCDWILNNIFDKLGEETRKVYKEELSDSLGIDHINDQLMRMDNDQRAQLEEIIDTIVKGKKVKITIDTDDAKSNS
jgi:hypothetical protein